MGLTLDKKVMERFEEKLREEEKSKATLEKYMRDARAFAAFLGDAPVTKEAAIRYKEHLSKRYAVSSANSMLAAVNSLPPHYRAVIYLFYYEGYQAAEIGKILGVPTATVHTRLARGRAKLKDILGGADDERSV